jgi:hypothetical protein
LDPVCGRAVNVVVVAGAEVEVKGTVVVVVDGAVVVVVVDGAVVVVDDGAAATLKVSEHEGVWLV